MLFISSAFLSMLTINFCILLHKDKQLFKLRNIPSVFSFLFVKEKLMLRVFKKYFSFFKPKFHPWDANNQSLVRKWLKTISD
jgi:predicted metal-dependent hydrolase